MLTEEEEQLLKKWIINQLESMNVETEPHALAEYILIHIKRDSSQQVISSLISDFLGVKPDEFVAELFRVVKSKEYLPKKAPPPPPTVTPDSFKSPQAKRPIAHSKQNSPSVKLEIHQPLKQVKKRKKFYDPFPESSSSSSESPPPSASEEEDEDSDAAFPKHKERFIVFATYLEDAHNSVISLSKELEKSHFERVIAIEERKDLGVAFIEFSNFHDAYKAVHSKRHLFRLPYVSMHFLNEPSEEAMNAYLEDVERKKKEWEERKKIMSTPPET